MEKILIIEDNAEYRSFLKDVLEENGYTVEEADTPLKGIEKIAKKQFSLVISDLNLPMMTGVDMIESAKNISPTTAFIILTGHPDESSEIASIKHNVDLYIEKSKPIPVILEYIEKILAQYRDGEFKNAVLSSRSENISVNLKEHRVYKNDVEIILTPKEFNLLVYFLTNKNLVLSREDILNNGWVEEIDYIDLRIVDSHVKNLR